MRRALVALLAAVLVGGCTGEPASPHGTGRPTVTPPPEASTLAAPEQAASADELLGRLRVADRGIREATGTELSQAAFTQQVLYRQLARRPGWQATVLEQLPDAAAVRDHLTARASLRSVLTTLSDRLPAWRVVPPTPLPRLTRIYREAADTHGVPWELLAAINFVETGFGKIRGLSSAGARGPMQFMPATWDAYGQGDVNDPRDAIHAAARYLAARGGSPFDERKALWAYNQHDGYVDGVQAYASILRRDPDALRGLHQWQILYLSEHGDVWLPVGYREARPISVGSYLRQYPERLLSSDTR